MNRRRLAGATAVVLALGAIVFYSYQRWGGGENVLGGELLAEMPTAASVVVYADLNELRQSPFLAVIYKWAPPPTADPEYAQFVQATGFDYARDLNRLAVALGKHGQDATLFAVADGRFDRKRIVAYASQTGTREVRSGREILSVPASGAPRRVSFTFLRHDRIALTDGLDLGSLVSASHKDEDTLPWRERFRRLAGSPVFAVVRQDGAVGAALGAQAPGALQSKQLSALLDQLQWITIAAKPENDRMRMVLEGECSSDATMRQLSDLLNGVLVLAQTGLSDPSMRRQLEPQVREAYLEMLKSAEVSQIDRSETKSVRLVFDLTPKFLEAARTAGPLPPSPRQNKPLPNRAPTRN